MLGKQLKSSSFGSPRFVSVMRFCTQSWFRRESDQLLRLHARLDRNGANGEYEG
jgi:hypothetical protein